MKLIRRLQYFLNRRKIEAELAEEMAFHQSMSGKIAMGNTTLAREDARAVWVRPWLESIWQDVAYALRSFRRQPGFAAVSVIALAAGIGLNTSLFTVFNAVALRPWTVPDPGRVVKIFSWTKNPPKGMDNAGGFSLAEFRYVAEHARSFSGMFAARNVAGPKLNQAKVRMEYVTGDYFRALDLHFDRGRGFLPEEDDSRSPAAVAVLSYTAWQNRFGGDPEIVGRKIELDETPFIVVGVAPASFAGTSPEATELWLPFSSMLLLDPNERFVRGFLESPDSCCSDVTGRLAPGVTRNQAQAELSVLHARFGRHQETDGVVLASTALLDRPGRKTRQIYAVFGLMFGGVLLVLLLACANVGNLLLARAAARRREIGIRLSVGAGRRRVVRQLLTESFLLALLAGALGVGMAYLLPGPLFRSAVDDISMRLTPDGTVLAFTLGLAALACIAFGLAPALHATRGNIGDAVRKNNTRLPLRSFLLAVQVSISVVLLVGTGLLIRGVQRARTQDPGFAVRSIAVISLGFPANAYPRPRIATFYRELSTGLAAKIGFSATEPLGNSRALTGFRLPGQTEDRPVVTNSVSPEYFDVLKIPILLGRNFNSSDPGRKAVLVNEVFVNQFLHGINPVGRTITMIDSEEIVGVVGNARTWGLDAVEPAIYTPISYALAPRLLLNDTPANIAAVQAAVKTLDARVRLDVRPLSANLERWLGPTRVGASIVGILGLLALALATIGIAGVYQFAVQQRTEEIGIRMALGARQGQVIRLVLGSAAWPLALGMAAGLAAASAGSRVIRQYLFGLSPLDAATYALVLATLAAAGLIATVLPARRALRVDPVRALHYE